MWLLTYLEKILCVLICMYLNFYPLEGCYKVAQWVFTGFDFEL